MWTQEEYVEYDIDETGLSGSFTLQTGKKKVSIEVNSIDFEDELKKDIVRVHRKLHSFPTSTQYKKAGKYTVQRYLSFVEKKGRRRRWDSVLFYFLGASPEIIDKGRLEKLSKRQLINKYNNLQYRIKLLKKKLHFQNEKGAEK